MIHNRVLGSLVNGALGPPHPWRLATSIISVHSATKPAHARSASKAKWPKPENMTFPRPGKRPCIISADKGSMTSIMGRIGAPYRRGGVVKDERTSVFLSTKYDWPLSHHLTPNNCFFDFCKSLGTRASLFLTWTNGKMCTRVPKKQSPPA